MFEPPKGGLLQPRHQMFLFKFRESFDSVVLSPSHKPQLKDVQLQSTCGMMRWTSPLMHDTSSLSVVFCSWFYGLDWSRSSLDGAAWIRQCLVIHQNIWYRSPLLHLLLLFVSTQAESLFEMFTEYESRLCLLPRLLRSASENVTANRSTAGVRQQAFSCSLHNTV